VEKIIELFGEVFKKLEWEYNYNEKEKFFSLGVEFEPLGYLYIYVSIYQGAYAVYTVCEHSAGRQYFNLIAEYLHRANYGMQNGNFEMDYSDGEIRYKAYVIFEEENISIKIVQRSVLIGILMFEKYGEGLLKIMSGEDINPEKWIEIVERDIREQ